MRRLPVLLLPLTLACSLVAPLSPSPPAETPSTTSEISPTYTGLGLESLGTYQATFEMRFKGTFDWSYYLETRTDGNAVEYRLHLEGLSASRNPGDVRLVMEDRTSRMRGPGTDEECVQFPSDLDLGPIFLTPDDLINPQGLQEPLVSLSAETIAGVETTHYTVRQASLDDWHDLKVDLWLDAATGAALRYDLRAAGPDPLFGAGEGVLSGQFLVNEVGPQVIEPITGCEIGLPLPPDAKRLVRLPGLIAFESVATPAEITAFYQAALAEAGWEPLAEPQVGADAVLSSYRRGEQTLEINIETSDAGVHVELLPSRE